MTKTIMPFLFYVKDGACYANSNMPASGESFVGFLSAAGIIRNQHKHSKDDVEVSLHALRQFVKSLTLSQELKQKDLLKYI